MKKDKQNKKEANKRRIVVKGESRIVDVFVNVEGGVLITVDKKYFGFYLPLKPKDKNDTTYEFMTNIPIEVGMIFAQAILKSKIKEFKARTAKNMSKMGQTTQAKLETVH